MNLKKSHTPVLKLVYKPGNVERIKIICSKDAADAFRKGFNADTLEYSEEFFAFFLNKANETISYIKISQGGTSGTVVDPKIIFASALIAGASSMIVAHNHPSGNTSPSTHDIKLTKKLKQAGQALDMPVLDSLIITKKSYYSMADVGEI